MSNDITAQIEGTKRVIQNLEQQIKLLDLRIYQNAGYDDEDPRSRHSIDYAEKELQAQRATAAAKLATLQSELLILIDRRIMSRAASFARQVTRV